MGGWGGGGERIFLGNNEESEVGNRIIDIIWR